jgi:hypothetical protein
MTYPRSRFAIVVFLAAVYFPPARAQSRAGTAVLPLIAASEPRLDSITPILRALFIIRLTFDTQFVYVNQSPNAAPHRPTGVSYLVTGTAVFTSPGDRVVRLTLVDVATSEEFCHISVALPFGQDLGVPLRPAVDSLLRAMRYRELRKGARSTLPSNQRLHLSGGSF